MILILKLVQTAFQIYTLLLFARILVSWVPELNRYKAMDYVRQLTDPYLNFFRGIIPPLGMIDFSPIIAFIALGFLEKVVVRILILLI